MTRPTSPASPLPAVRRPSRGERVAPHVRDVLLVMGTVSAVVGMSLLTLQAAGAAAVVVGAAAGAGLAVGQVLGNLTASSYAEACAETESALPEPEEPPSGG